VNALYIEPTSNEVISSDLTQSTEISAIETNHPLPSHSNHPKVLNVDVSPQCIKFWRGLYNRFEFGIHPRDSLDEILVATQSHIVTLEEHITFIEEVK